MNPHDEVILIKAHIPYLWDIHWDLCKLFKEWPDTGHLAILSISHEWFQTCLTLTYWADGAEDVSEVNHMGTVGNWRVPG